MRNYKFRAFDKRTGKMIQTGIQFNNTTMELDCIPDLILMQFTGLLDRQGKEIYEGDILAMSSHNVYVVVFRDGAFAEIHNPDDGWIHWLKDGGEVRKGKRQHFDEVIGNIYENKELLDS